MKVHFIQHDAWVTPGEYRQWAVRKGFAVSFTRCWKYEALPQTADADMLVVLGGHQNPAMTRAECDYFRPEAEKQLIRSYAEAHKAVIGVCLGAQLVGEAMGAPYAHSPCQEIRPVKARLTLNGRRHPFFQSFPDTFDAGEWHNDMPGLTPDCQVLAESDGCPRQIVQYAQYVYGFQTHMEFTHEIMEAGLKNADSHMPAEGPYIQSAQALLSYDYTAMNRMLSSFLDALLADYRMQNRSIPKILEKMIAFSQGNIHDIDHLIRVWANAKLIGAQENLPPETQYLLEIAAITHDIACPLCREKYGNTNGKHQEREGARMVRDFLADTGMTEAQIDRIAYLVGHHHTLENISSPDLQILIEADYIANASENGYSVSNLMTFMQKIMKTGSSKSLLRSIFCLPLPHQPCPAV